MPGVMVDSFLFLPGDTMTIYVGRTQDAHLGVKCTYPGCPDWATHRHHIVYNPDVIKPLCAHHHQQITNLNGIQARKCHHRLRPEHRWKIWYLWLEGKLKPRNTRRCREWWDREAQENGWRQLSPDEREKREIEELLGKKFNTVEEARAEQRKQSEPPAPEPPRKRRTTKGKIRARKAKPTKRRRRK